MFWFQKNVCKITLGSKISNPKNNKVPKNPIQMTFSQNKFWVKKILGENKFWVEKILGENKFWVGYRFFVQNKIFVQKNSGVKNLDKKNLNQKK